MRRNRIHGPRTIADPWLMAVLLVVIGLPGLARADDAAAVMKRARAMRATWGPSFPGFTAAIAVNLDGHVSTGQVRVSPRGRVSSDLADPEAAGWVRDQLGSIVFHRGAGAAPDTAKKSASRRPPVVFRFATEDASNPLGRLIVAENDRFHSAYRVRDDAITEVHRTMGDERMTIAVLEAIKNAEGRYLTTHFTVNTWRTADHHLVENQTHSDTWVRVGSYDLPRSHLVVSAANAEYHVHQFVLSNDTLGAHSAAGTP